MSILKYYPLSFQKRRWFIFLIFLFCADTEAEASDKKEVVAVETTSFKEFGNPDFYKKFRAILEEDSIYNQLSAEEKAKYGQDLFISYKYRIFSKWINYHMLKTMLPILYSILLYTIP